MDLLYINNMIQILNYFELLTQSRYQDGNATAVLFFVQ